MMIKTECKLQKLLIGTAFLLGVGFLVSTCHSEAAFAQTRPLPTVDNYQEYLYPNDKVNPDISIEIMIQKEPTDRFFDRMEIREMERLIKQFLYDLFKKEPRYEHL